MRKQVLALRTDLRERSENVDQYRSRLRSAYEQARAARLTADTYGSWRDERITQAAVAWVMGTVFVRFCEDNGLIGRPFIAGPGRRLSEAEGRQDAYRAEHPRSADREWLLESFTHLARSHRAMAHVFDMRHSPLWQLSPSPEVAAGLVVFWRQRDRDGSIRFDFTDPELDTRFLGDLYQDISDTAAKTYALVQTPDFIEGFILDLTVDPAIAEFGPQGFRGIDPACGSGTFLLGLFERLLGAWRALEPGTADRELVHRALESVHGCDLNPFAGSITRFRLLMAATRASGERELGRVPQHVINVAVGDALLGGRGAPVQSPPNLAVESDDVGAGTAEDIAEFSERCDLLGADSYHVVLGEPPYTVVRDKYKKAAYRETYATAVGVFPLSVLFVERMFQLALRGTGGEPGGYVGQWMPSSFTRRGFGEKLIEEFLPRVGLTHVIDTSGVYVPSHRTPTLILIGRNDPSPCDAPVRSVLGVRGEPVQPQDPTQGIVWKAILDQIDRPGTASEWVSVQDEPRQRYFRFPWTMAGGGGADLMDALSRAPRRLSDVLSGPPRVAADPGQRDVFSLGRPWFTRHPDSASAGLGMVTGETVRDWRAGASTEVVAPYDEHGSPLALDVNTAWGRHLWTMRQVLRTAPGARDSSRARPWWTWRIWALGDHRGPAITFAYAATHNHFALGSGRKAFSRTAPLLPLPSDTDEDDLFATLGVLNSSAVCFWLKQTNVTTGADGLDTPLPGQEWARPYLFVAASFSRLPLPGDTSPARARELHDLGLVLDAHEPSDVCAGELPPNRSNLDEARAVQERARHRMTALQEELDWDVYGSYGLLSADERTRLSIAPGTELPPLRPGERAFEIVLARKVADGTASSSWFQRLSWFDRHGVTPVTEVPNHWPAAYRDVVQARVDAIESGHAIALVERPDYKRRWLSDPWAKREEQALRFWLLDRCEDERLWFERRSGARHPRPQTIDQLAQALGDDTDVTAVAALYAADHLGRQEATLGEVLTAVLATEHVPYASAKRYKESGLRKRAQWEQVWELQRREDETGEALGIPVPPKFVSADFQRASYWSIRGSLDIPRERFISYPEAVVAGQSLLLGWSGWSEADRVRVLLELANAHHQQPHPSAYRITPLLIGIQELIPWIRQWEAHPGSGLKPGQAEVFQQEFDRLRTAYGLTTYDLTSWRARKDASE
ncbi:BREX-2 system adenine-specific DNA-methyltransferase PglX [Streptomyces virginiae]